MGSLSFRRYPPSCSIPRRPVADVDSGRSGSDITETGDGHGSSMPVMAVQSRTDRRSKRARALYQGALIMTHRDGFPRLSARSAWRSDAGHRQPCAPSQSYGPSESLGKPPPVARASRRSASESLADVPHRPRLASYPPVGPTDRPRDLYGSLSTLLGIRPSRSNLRDDAKANSFAREQYSILSQLIVIRAVMSSYGLGKKIACIRRGLRVRMH